MLLRRGERPIMRGMAKFTTACLVVCATLFVWAEGAAGGGGSKMPSIHVSGVAANAWGTITPEHIRWHVRFLSQDLLEGRGTGQRGGDLAAEYIATQFWLDGLTAAGENGTFFQKVPMVGVTPAPETTFEILSSKGESLRPK